MNPKIFLNVAWIVFLLIATLHLMRIAFGAPLYLGGVRIPLWVDGASFIIMSFLAFQGFRLSHKME